jgi:hypothetical protein
VSMLPVLVVLLQGGAGAEVVRVSKGQG